MDFARTRTRLGHAASARAFIRACRAPETARADLWQRIWSVLKSAPMWRTHASKNRLSDFELSDYGQYSQLLEQDASSGSPSPLSSISGLPITRWVETAATTGPRKVFPFNPLYSRQLAATQRPFVANLLSRYRHYLAGPVLDLSGDDATALATSPFSALTSREALGEWAPIYAVASELSAIIVRAPARVARFAEQVTANKAHIWACLSGHKPLPPSLPKLRLTKGRLATIEHAFADRGLDFRRLWPKLDFVACWKSGAAGLQQAQLRAFIGEQTHLVDAPYMATETALNVPLGDPRQVGGPLHPGATLVEFLPLTAPPVAKSLLQSWQLEPGHEYEIVVTNLLGLIRYRLFDVVICNGFFHRSPILEFSHRSNVHLELGKVRFGEAQLIEAILKTGLAPTASWMFAPNASNDGLILFSRGEVETLSPAVTPAVAALDRALCELNRSYANALGDGRFQPLTVARLPLDHRLWRHDDSVHAAPQCFVTTHPT